MGIQPSTQEASTARRRRCCSSTSRPSRPRTGTRSGLSSRRGSGPAGCCRPGSQSQSRPGRRLRAKRSAPAMAARLALRRTGWTTRMPQWPVQLLQQAPVTRMVSSSFSPPSFLAQKNLAHERVIPVIDGYNFYVAQPDWTDALLNRLAATRSAREIEPFEVTARVSRLSLHIARIQEESFGRFGLNRGEVGVLAALMLAGPKQRLSPTQLFKGLMLSSAGITSRLDRLERRGYVKRTPHPSDRRGVLVELTAAGRKVLEQAVAADAAGAQGLLASLAKDDKGAMAALLKKLLAGLEAT